jgi:ATP-binding cassette subfamily B (MDR/TAP) protein 1
MAIKIKQIETQNVMKRLLPFSTPYCNTIVGSLVLLVNGAVFPVFGIFITNMLFALMTPDMEIMRQESNKWCLGMFLCAVVAFFAMAIGKSLFGVVGENLTKSVRVELYKSLIIKNIGWFDLKENSPGILTSCLASDV